LIELYYAFQKKKQNDVSDLGGNFSSGSFGDGRFHFGSASGLILKNGK